MYMKKIFLSLFLFLYAVYSPAQETVIVLGPGLKPAKGSETAFHEGLAHVVKEDKSGFIDTEGNIVIPCKYHAASDFSEGVARVWQDGKCFFIDKSGKQAVPGKFDYAENFSDGLAWYSMASNAAI